MKNIKLIITALLILFLSSCFNNEHNSGYPLKTPAPGLFSPISLQPDSSEIYLCDYFPDISSIDSFQLASYFNYLFNKKEMKLTVWPVKKEIPTLSEMKIFSGGTPYTVLLKKSGKIKRTFVFIDKNRKYSKVQIAGEFNNWNPSAFSFASEKGKWEKDMFLAPGCYQYQIVADGKWMPDPANPDSADNNIGGYNSVLCFSNETGNVKKPELFTVRQYHEKIFISAEHMPDSIFVLWQNFRLMKNFIKKDTSSAIITIPSEAEKLERSYIRVYSYNEAGCSNDLFIPLKYGKVIIDAADLKRTDLQSQVMYFLLVDRFYDGDNSNDHPVKDPEVSPKANYMGGDFEGIINKIEDGYFSELGVNSLWISPVNLNPDKVFREYPKPHRKFSGYHGYWPISSTKVDYRFGTALEFYNLVRTAHRYGMNVILDYVANHVHQDHPLYHQHPGWVTKLNLPDGRKNIRLWDEYRLTTWFDTFLPTLDFSKPEVVECMTDSALYWIKTFNIDGFRHDATKHIPENYWRRLTQKIKSEINIPFNKSFYQIGETYGSRELIGSYVNSGELDAQFDFNLFFDMRNTLLNKNESFAKLSRSIISSLEYYGYHNLMGNITGNHDMARFISYASGALSQREDEKEAGWKRNIEVKDKTGYKKTSLLTLLVMTLPGVPVLYYGDEIGMPGAGDPDNRRMMKFNKLTKEENELKEIVKKLIKLRRSCLPLIFGDYIQLKTISSKYGIQDKDILAFARCYFGKTAIVIINKSDSRKEIFTEIPKHISDQNNDIRLTANFGSNFKITYATTKAKVIDITLKSNSFEILTNYTK